MIRFACECGKNMTAEDRLAGKTGPCPACGKPITVPEAENEQAEAGLDRIYVGMGLGMVAISVIILIVYLVWRDSTPREVKINLTDAIPNEIFRGASAGVPESAPIPFGEPMEGNGFIIRLESARIATPLLRTLFGDQERGKQERLIVRFSFRNTTGNRRFFIHRFIEPAKDDIGNIYQGLDENLFGESHKETLEPGETAWESKVIEKPLSSAKTLTVELSSRSLSTDPSSYSYGVDKPDYRFLLPISKISR